MPEATATDTTTTEPLNLRGSEYAALAVSTTVALAFGAYVGDVIGEIVEHMKAKKALGAGRDNPQDNPYGSPHDNGRYHYERGGAGHYGYRPASSRPGGAR
jgi:hypothetical protein